jgi:hypothetical protein
MGQRNQLMSSFSYLRESRPAWLRLKLKVVVAVLCLALPPSASARDIPISWSPDLHLASLDDIPERLNTPLSMRGYPANMKGVDLTTEWGGNWAGKPVVRVSTCSEFLKAKDAGYLAGNNFDVKRANAFVDECYVLYYLQNAKPAKQSFIPEGGWSREMFSELPPLFELSKAAREALAPGKSWEEFAPDVRIVKMTSDVLEADNDGFHYEIRLLARGDFTGDGREELAVAAWISAKQGSALYCKFFILTRLSDKGPMRVVVQKGEG